MRRAQRTVLPEAVRRHRNKSDPVRFQATEAALGEAFAQVRSIMAARGSPPSRNRYLDTERLVRDLDADRLRRRPPSGRLLRALQFLDF